MMLPFIWILNKVGVEVEWENTELNNAHVKFHISVTDSGENV